MTAVAAGALVVPGASGAARHAPKPISASSAFALPSAKHCIAKRRLALRVRKLHHVRWAKAVVKINGKRVKTLRRKAVTRSVTLRHLPPGTIHLSITARTRDGRHVTSKRTYRTCGSPGSPGPTGSQPSPTALAPGSYSGSAGGRPLAFYVSGDGAHLQDITATTSMACVGSSGVFGDQLTISDVAIAADGSFSATTTATGIVSGAPATFTYRFSGQSTSTGAAGTLREEISYDNGTVHSCSSNDQSWTATRDSQGDQTVKPPPAGSYAGSAGGRPIAFYVSGDGAHLQDIIATTSMTCLGTLGVFGDGLKISDVPIAADGSFSATTTEPGIVSGAPATFTYTFAGHVHGTTLAGAVRLAGALREEITYDDGTVHSCTSNRLSWTATRDAQGGDQAVAAPPAGAYSGSAGGRPLAFSVSGTHLQNITATTSITCLGTLGVFGDQLTIADVAIAADGSFSATTTATGVVSAAPATFTYTFAGHVHGTTLAGAARLAGVLREEITYDNGTVHSCTSNRQTWTATHG